VSGNPSVNLHVNLLPGMMSFYDNAENTYTGAQSIENATRLQTGLMPVIEHSDNAHEDWPVGWQAAERKKYEKAQR